MGGIPSIVDSVHRTIRLSRMQWKSALSFQDLACGEIDRRIDIRMGYRYNESKEIENRVFSKNSIKLKLSAVVRVGKLSCDFTSPQLT